MSSWQFLLSVNIQTGLEFQTAQAPLSMMILRGRILPYGASDSIVVALRGPDLGGLEPMAKS